MSRSDEDIRRDIEDRIKSDARVDKAGITVRVRDSEVTLSGTVSSYIALQAVEHDAWLVEGVTALRSDLDVDFPVIAGLPTDAEIIARVRKILEWNISIDEKRVTVRAVRGWVTLDGSVDAYWKKTRVEDIAANVWGVTGITNNIAVVPSRRDSDRNIAAAIVAAMKRNVSIDSENVNVRVENGVVTISGIVSGSSERREVHKILHHTRGVIDIRDHLVIRKSRPAYIIS